MTPHTVRYAWLPFAGLILSALLAVGLLWRPEILGDLSWGWRLPWIAVGFWALGAGFMHGLGLELTCPWGRRLLAAPLCWWGLAGFTLFVAGRWLLG